MNNNINSRTIAENYKKILNTEIAENVTVKDLQKETTEGNWLSRKIQVIKQTLGISAGKERVSRIEIDEQAREKLGKDLIALCEDISKLSKILETPTGKKSEISDLKKLKKITKKQTAIVKTLWPEKSETSSPRNTIENLHTAIHTSLKLRKVREKAAESLRRLDPVCVLAADHSEYSEKFQQHLIDRGLNEADFQLDPANIKKIYKEFVSEIVTRSIKINNADNSKINLDNVKTLKQYAKDKKIYNLTVIKNLEETGFSPPNELLNTQQVINKINQEINDKRVPIVKDKKVPITNNPNVQKPIDTRLIAANELSEISAMLHAVNTHPGELRIVFSEHKKQLITEKGDAQAQPEKTQKAYETILSQLENIASQPGILEIEKLKESVKQLRESESINDPELTSRVKNLTAIVKELEEPKSISEKKLFTHLMKIENAALRKTVLSSYHNFFTSDQLFTKIRELWLNELIEVIKQGPLSPEKQLTVLAEQENFLHFCYEWLKDDMINGGDHKDKSLQNSMQEMIQNIPNEPVRFSVYKQKIMELFQNPHLHLHAIKTEAAEEIKMVENAEKEEVKTAEPPLSALIADIVNNKKMKKADYEQAVNALAQDLNYMSINEMKQVTFAEISNKAWEVKPGEPRKNLHVNKLADQFNQVSDYITKSVLDTSYTHKQREKVIKFYAEVLKKLLSLDGKNTPVNFFMAWSIFSGLTKSSITRMLTIQFPSEIIDVLQPANNYKGYTDKLNQAKSNNIPVVSFIPKFLRDLIYFDDGNKSRLVSENSSELGLNIYKMQKYSQLFTDLREEIDRLPEIEDTLRYLPKNLPIVDQDDLYNASQKIFPKPEANSPKPKLPKIYIK